MRSPEPALPLKPILILILAALAGCAAPGGEGYVGDWRGAGGDWRIDRDDDGLVLGVNDAGPVAVPLDRVDGRDYLLPADGAGGGTAVLRLDRAGDRLRVWALDPTKLGPEAATATRRVQLAALSVPPDADQVDPLPRVIDVPAGLPTGAELRDLLRTAGDDAYVLVADLGRAG